MLAIVAIEDDELTLLEGNGGVVPVVLVEPLRGVLAVLMRSTYPDATGA